jgi:hypothetical protein
MCTKVLAEWNSRNEENTFSEISEFWTRQKPLNKEWNKFSNYVSLLGVSNKNSVFSFF